MVHNAPELHQANGVLPSLEDPFLHTKQPGEIGWDFHTFLIAYHSLHFCCVKSHSGDHSLLFLHKVAVLK